MQMWVMAKTSSSYQGVEALAGAFIVNVGMRGSV